MSITHRKDLWTIQPWFSLGTELQIVLIFLFVLTVFLNVPQEICIPCAIFLQISVQGHKNLGTHEMLKKWLCLGQDQKRIFIITAERWGK